MTTIPIENPVPAVGMYVEPDQWGIGNNLEASDWDMAQFRLEGSHVKSAVNIRVTGRKGVIRHGSVFVRVQIEFVGDGEPSTFSGGWMLVKR